MAELDIGATAKRLEGLLDRGFGTGEKGLAHALQKAGRRLPRRMRRAGRAVADADFMAGHPKLAWQIDRKRVGREAGILEDYLKAVNPNKRRVDMLLSILRSLAVNFLVLGLLIYAVLRWRGWL